MHINVRIQGANTLRRRHQISAGCDMATRKEKVVSWKSLKANNSGEEGGEVNLAS